MNVSLTFAITSPDGALFGQLLPWLLALLGVVVIGGAGIWAVRRSLNKQSADGASGFTLQDLRDMKASGQLDELQFERARDAMIGRLSEPSGTGHEPDETTR